MATLYTHQESNIAKTWVLMSVFFAVVVAIGWGVSYYFDNPGKAQQLVSNLLGKS